MSVSRHTAIVEVYPRTPDVIYRVDREESWRTLLLSAAPVRRFAPLAGEASDDLERLITAALDSDALVPARVGYVNGHLVVVR